ncbi:MAG: hypothetical protein ACRETO_06525 [Gammaproteobacteria bacterium]
MNNTADFESRFLDRSRSVFAASLSSMDAGVVARLRVARQRAVAAADRQPAWHMRAWALPVGVAALVFAGVISSALFWSQSEPNSNAPFAAANNNDMAIVLSNDNLDMYADMDFYRWLQAQQQSQPEQGHPGNDDNG